MIHGKDRSCDRRVLQLAIKTMPSARSSWVDAMVSEFCAIPSAGERLRFAVGCLKTAVYQRIRTRIALAWIGRGAIAFGLICMSGYGAFLTSQVSTHDAPGKALILSLCSLYALAAPLAMLSLNALRCFAGAGLISAMAGVGWFLLSGAQYLGMSTNHLATLIFEAGIVMGALLVAAVYLSLVNDPDTETTSDA